jgi:hypothetical protein
LFCDRSLIAKNSPPLRFFTFSLLFFLFLFFCSFEFSNFESWSCQPIFVAFSHFLTNFPVADADADANADADADADADAMQTE